MRLFTTVYDSKGEDKLIGGYFSMRQGIYLLFFISLSLVLIMLPIFNASLRNIILGKANLFGIIVKIVLFIMLNITGVIFAFVNPFGMYMHEYILALIGYKTRKKSIQYE